MRDEKGALMEEVLRLKRRMDSLYERSFPAAPEGREDEPPGGCDFEPAFDIFEGPAGWRAVVDLPGVRDEDLKVEVAGSHLTVSGRRPRGEDSQGLSPVRTGRPLGAFRVAFDLPAGADLEAVSAELRRGVLTVSSPATSREPRHSPGCSPGTSPARARARVLLPDPEGPTTSRHCPGSTSKSTPRNAGSARLA